jgi:O-antigen/teichoic acid export membrane protein
MLKSIAVAKGFAVAKLVSHIRTPLYRNAYALMLSTATTSSLGLVYWLLAARYYPSAAVGVNAAVISVMIFLSGVSQLNLMSAMIRFIPSAGRATSRLVSASYLISVIISVAIGAIFVLGIDLWSPSLSFLGASPWFFLWFILGTAAWSIFALQDNVLTGLRQAIWLPIENLAYAVAKIGLLIIFATVFVEYGIFASWTIPLVLALIPVNCLIFRRLVPQHVQATEGQAVSIVPSAIIKFVAGNYLGSLFLLASTRLLPVIVMQQVGAVANAYFYLPWMISTSIKLITSNMAMSLTVEGATDQKKLAAHSVAFLGHTARLLMPMIAVVLIIAPYILRFSGNSYATEGATLLRLLVLSAIPNIITSLYISIARVRHRVHGIVMVQGAVCVLGLGMSYMFLEPYGIKGVGLAVLVSETIVAVALTLIQLRRIVGLVAPQGLGSSS